MPSPPANKTLAYAAWAAVCLIWGTTYLGIRVSLETMPPFLMGGLRWILGGTLLGGVLVAQGNRLPARADLPALATMGVLLIGLGNGGVVVAEQWVSSGLTAVIIATSPFWMVGVESVLPGSERLTPRRIGGLFLGFLGIVLLVWPELQRGGVGGGGHFGAGVIALQIACAGWALGSSYSRRHTPAAGTLMTAAGEMVFGGALLLAIGSVRHEWSVLRFTPRTATAFFYLATIGAVGGFGSYVYALRHLPVSFVSLYSYINPMIAVILGVLVLHEPFGTRMMLAAALVLLGAFIVKKDGAPN